ncbi:MAG: electron transfer flavoprotein subunit alpha/FixB family protein [Pseudomonadota bacterium]
MAVLIVADVQDGALDEATAKVVTAGAAIGGDVDILLAGEGVGDAAKAAAQISGVRKVLTADAAHYANRLAENAAALIVSLTDGYDAVISAATTSGKNIMPRVAALLDVMQISDIVAVEAPDQFVRPIYAGNAMQTVKSSDAKKVITVRPTAFKAAEMGGSAAIEDVAAVDAFAGAAFVGEELTKSDRPELAAAKIVVSGGRALGSYENFEQVIFPLADKLGAAVGASRAAVDAGYMPNDYQVGQTGKVVAPELYVAVGISGAIQHLAGMKDSKVIVAINKDEEAPIFQVADYGLVADLFKAVPELTDALG